MSRRIYVGDGHLGKENVINMRPQFSSDEEHDEVVFDNIASFIRPRDTVVYCGDMTDDIKWVERLAGIKCVKKEYVLGNHCLDKKMTIQQLAQHYAFIQALYSKRNIWHSHCPIHPSQFRGRTANIHSHLHTDVLDDERYKNCTLELWDFKPVTFEELMATENNKLKRKQHGPESLLP